MTDATDRLRRTVDPASTVVLTFEMQKGIMGDDAVLPALPIAAREMGLLATAGRVVRAARTAGVRVIHATIEERPDRAGQIVNCKLAAICEKRVQRDGYSSTQTGQPGVDLVDELDVQPSDIKIARSHGYTPFNGTELDAMMRKMGVRTIVLLGASVNVGIMGAVISAVDLGYQVVVVRDGVCGLPAEYTEMVMEHTFSMLATLPTADELITVWS